MERSMLITWTHRATYAEGFVKEVRSPQGELIPAFGLRKDNALTLSPDECESTLELLRCQYDELYAFAPIHLSVA